MGAPKQKWSDAEEQALKNGVAKYGPGKWRAIQKDPKFGPALTARSNVDLKDKWRNMSVGEGGTGATPAKGAAASAEKPKKEKAAAASPAASKKKFKASQYEEQVVAAITALKGSCNFTTIAKWIEDQWDTGSDFRKKLQVKVKVMVNDKKLKQGKGGIYSLAEGGKATPKRGGSSRGSLQQTAAAAKQEAAKAMAEAEKAARAAEQAAREAEKAEMEAVVAEAAAKRAQQAATRPPKKR